MRKSIMLAALLLAIALAAPAAAATIYTKPPTPLTPEEEEAAGLLLDGSIIVGFADACDIDAKPSPSKHSGSPSSSRLRFGCCPWPRSNPPAPGTSRSSATGKQE